MPIRSLSWFLLVLGVAAGLAAFGAHAGIESYPFAVTAERSEDGYNVVARNGGPATISVLAVYDGENIDPALKRAAPAVVPAGSERIIGRIGAVDASLPYRFSFAFHYRYGVAGAQHDDETSYRLPFPAGLRVAVAQAYGGMLTSHDNPESRHAVDFTVPVGTPVVAARTGIVVEVVTRHTEGGLDPRFLDRANRVLIEHADGTIGEYAHLAPGASPVEPGDRIAAGTIIGLSGNTGYSSGPHLHFAVSRTTLSRGELTQESVPVRFHFPQPGATQTLREGESLLVLHPELPEADVAALRETETGDASPVALSVWPGLAGASLLNPFAAAIYRFEAIGTAAAR